MAVGVAGLYLAGKKNIWGWAVGFAAQFLWLAYALVTRQYGFIISAVVYGVVYARNFYAWKTPVLNDGVYEVP
jgi:dolichol kinase